MTSSATKWRTHPRPKTSFIPNKVVQIHDSIWYSTHHDKGERGMVEYCLKKNKTKKIIPYPSNLRISRHSLCRYKNTIYIIDGKNRIIVQFNPNTKKFILKAKFSRHDKIGNYPTCTAVYDTIHIYNGSENGKGKAWIYHPMDVKFQPETIKDPFAKSRIYNGCLLDYKDTLLRFGGYNTKDFVLMHSDMVVVNGYIHSHESCLNLGEIPAAIIHMIHLYCQKCDACPGWIRQGWVKVDRLKAIHGCGHIIYRNFVILFGGFVKGYGCIDNIFILNYQDINKGWVKSKIKCPEKSLYRAVLTSNNDVHLFRADEEAGHYSMPAALLL